MLIRPLRKNAVPVIVLTGFLGAGKTTIVNHILRAAVGSRIAVIVNDFGSVNIDALLIVPHTDRKVELTNGCVCCFTEGGELDEALDAAIESKPDIIVIEASGLAEPEDLKRLIILNQNKMVGYGGVVYVVDAANYEQTRTLHPEIVGHVALADLIVLTKAEYLSQKQIVVLENALKKEAIGPVIRADQGQVAPELLFDMTLHQVVQPSLLQQDGHEHRHLHELYTSMSFETTRPINPQLFKVFMDTLPKTIYRAKGSVYFGLAGYEQRFIVQSVGRRWDMYAEEWPDHMNPSTNFVAIGSGFTTSEVRAALEETIGESDVLLDIERYSS